MTKTLGAAALQLYTSVASMLLPIPPEEQPVLLADLEADPFVEHAVSSATCEMYHRFGMYLAPVTAALTTLRHCRFGDSAHNMDKDGDRPDSCEATTATECHDDRVNGGGESDSTFADG